MQYFGSKISENISKREPEGYLYCLNVPIARTGVQKYLANEIGLSGREVVEVHRIPEEVFKATAIASFEGMPVTREHPPDEVGVKNIAAYQKGHVQNVRRGKGDETDLLLADLVITHEELVDDILHNNVRDVSCGYEVEYKEASDGKVYQVGIRGNHVAVVDSGRAGDRIAIRDTANPEIEESTKQERSAKAVESTKKGSVFARMFASFARDEAVKPDEVIEAADELFAKADEDEGTKKEDNKMDPKVKEPTPQAPPKDEDNKLTFDEGEQLMQLITELSQEVKALKELVMTKPAAQDADEVEYEDEYTPDPYEEEEPDALDALEEEAIEGNEDEPMNEGSVTVPPEDIDVENQDPVEEPKGGIGADKTREAVVAAIAELKPIVAGMPAKDRRRAADAMSRAIRKAAGMPSYSTEQARQKLAAVAARKKPMTKDSRSRGTGILANDVGRALGERIMKARNPHYQDRTKK